MKQRLNGYEKNTCPPHKQPKSRTHTKKKNKSMKQNCNKLNTPEKSAIRGLKLREALKMYLESLT